MSERLEVIITGKDGVSRVFHDVARSAKAAGDAVEAAGKSGSVWDELDAEAKQAAHSMRLAADSAEDAGDSVKRSGQSARESAIDFDKLGAAAVIVGGYLTVAGNSALDQIQTIEGLRSAYGDAADEMLAFADQMAATTIFNDDDILRGERYFATLANNYDLTIAQVQQLMQTTADLASAYGTSFEDASSRITAAIRGEGEAAEFLGLTMNQQAIDRENLTLTMSNQEAAAFRLNALYAQTDVYAGTAQRLVETEVGARARLTNSIQDNTQALANMIGPYNAILAGAATGAVGIAQFAGGFGALARGAVTATTALRGAAMASAAFAATPVGAVVTAVGVAVAIGTGLWMNHREEVKAAEEQYRSMIETAADLREQISDLRLEDWSDANWAEGLTTKIGEEITWQADWLRDTLQKSFGTGDWFDQMVWAGGGIPMFAQAGEIEAAWQTQADKLIDSIIPDDADRERVDAAFSDLLTLRGVDNINFDAIQSEINRLFAAFNAGNGQITAEEFGNQLISLYENNLQAAQGFDITTMAVNDLAAAHQTWMDLGAGSIGEQTEEMGQLTAATQEATAETEAYLAVRQKMAEEDAKAAAAQEAWWADYDSIAEQERRADEDRAERRRRERAEFKEMALESLEARRQEEMLNTRLAGAEIMLNQGVKASIMEVKAAYADLAAAREEELFALMTSITGMDNPLDQWNASSGSTPYSQVALDATNAATALESVQRVIIGNTDAMGGLSQSAADWANELIGVEGVVGEIDTAYQRWIASGMEATQAQLLYNDAQAAATSVFASNAAIQEHIQDIQIAQAPLIAEQTAALETQLGIIAGYEPALQLTALAWMDSASAAKALEIATMATAVANGELGASGEAAFAKYLTGLAAVDPVMKALLIDMGLIEEGADGTITVNMDGAEGAISDIDRLTSAIVALVDLMDNGVLDGSFSIDLEAEDNATPAIQGVLDHLTGLDGQTANVTATADDPATPVINGVGNLLSALDGDSANTTANTVDNSSGVLGGVSSLLSALDGRTATTYVNTVYTGTNYGGGSGLAEMHGGVIGRAMGGTVPVMTSEAGTEILHLATGGSIPMVGKGVRYLPPGAYVEPAPSAQGTLGGITFGPIIVQGSVIRENELTVSLARSLYGALGSMIDEQFGGLTKVAS